MNRGSDWYDDFYRICIIGLICNFAALMIGFQTDAFISWLTAPVQVDAG